MRVTWCVSAQTDEPLAQNPYDRVAFIRPFWESLSQEERVSLLTVSLDDVRQRAAEHAKKAKALGKSDRLYVVSVGFLSSAPVRI